MDSINGLIPPSERTGFRFDAERNVLLALAFVEMLVPSQAQTWSAIRWIVGDLNRRLAEDSRTSGGGRFWFNEENHRLYLVREYDLAVTVFDDILLSLRRLERAARRWGLIGPLRLATRPLSEQGDSSSAVISSFLGLDGLQPVELAS